MGWFGLNVFGVEWLQMPLFFSYSREPIRDGQKRERNPVLNFQLDPAHTHNKCLSYYKRIESILQTAIFSVINELDKT